MKFSFVIPVYNVEKTIERCVKSITSQTYQDMEILLVNDGSLDASGEICEQLANQDARIKVIHQHNAGSSSARNNGIRSASGEYVLFMDSDDYWSEKLTILDEIADQLKESSADVLIYDVTKSISGKEEYQGVANFDRSQVLGQSPEIALKKLIASNKLMRSAWSKVIKMKLIKEYNLHFLDGKGVEDIPFTADLIRVAKSYDWYNYYVYVYVKAGAGTSLSSSRISAQKLKDSYDNMKYSYNQGLLISDLEVRKLYFSYLAYPYAVLLGQAKEANKRNVLDSDTILKKLGLYRELLTYNLNPQCQLIACFYKIGGYDLTVKTLGIMMGRTYRKQGA